MAAAGSVVLLLAAKVAKLRCIRVWIKGTPCPVPGQGEIDLAVEDTWQMPGKYKSVSRFDLNGQAFTQTQLLNDGRGWMVMNGQVQPLPQAALDEMREQKYAEDLDRLLDLKKRQYKLTALKAISVDGRPAVGVKVSSKGHRDVKLYCDKANGLLVKREQTSQEPIGQVVRQEVFFRDYTDRDGVKHWSRIAANRDGKEFAALEVVEIEFFDKLPDKVFAKP